MNISTPLSNETIAKLQLGDIVYITGKLFTARDRIHKYLAEGNAPPVDLQGQVIYHAGPIAVRKNGKWEFWAFGPTTSVRQEPYTPYLIEKLGVKVIIGKGGMGKEVQEACRKHKAVYLHTIGGGGVILANCVKKVSKVYLQEFGMPEAMWEVEVEGFPAICTIDSRGQSLHTEIHDQSIQKLEKTNGKHQKKLQHPKHSQVNK
ncbi:MAG: FumA C-terminus/TtdB family hydratase beta subunit [Candidatus Gracilibacteria bacterium]|nr:FumA C-terminus/TtdB family hydratase beta subunit [Candidatus Gracilibacteria bacterium]